MSTRDVQNTDLQTFLLREQRRALAIVDGIVVLFLPVFVYLFLHQERLPALATATVAWALDATSLALIATGRMQRVARGLTLAAMTLIIAILFLIPTMGGYGFLLLYTVPPVLVFIGRGKFALLANALCAMVYIAGVFEVVPLPWTIPDGIPVRFTIAATFVMIVFLTIMVEGARNDSHRALEWLATHDPITRLPTRLAINASDTAPRGCALLISLRDVADLGARYGRETMQAVRREVASRLTTALEGRGEVFQYSEGTALIELPNHSVRAAEQFVESLLGTLLKPVAAEARVIQPAVSVAATTMNAGERMGDITSQLAMTLPVSYRMGPNRVAWYERSIEEAQVDRLHIGDRLVEAIEHSRLTVAYQPILYAGDDTTPDLEVLVRWHDAQLGTVPPARFIPIAEERGVIADLTEQVIRTSWRELGNLFPTQRIGAVWVNLSPVHMRTPDFVESFRECFARHGVDADRYAVELTEGALIDERIVGDGTLPALRNAGFRISIDDFGTGYSNLDYLRRFDVDRLKIDRSFVSGVTDGSRQMMILRAILTLAQSLGLRTVAEGVETDEEWALMRRLGVDACQGYFIGKPMTIEGLREFLDGTGLVALSE